MQLYHNGYKDGNCFDYIFLRPLIHYIVVAVPHFVANLLCVLAHFPSIELLKQRLLFLYSLDITTLQIQDESKHYEYNSILSLCYTKRNIVVLSQLTVDTLFDNDTVDCIVSRILFYKIDIQHENAPLDFQVRMPICILDSDI